MNEFVIETQDLSKTFRGGEQRKAAILLAFAAQPKVLILDESAGGLDPVARRQLVDEIVDLVSNDDEHTILFSTHNISDIERIVEYVGIMEKGHIVMSTPLEDLQKKTKQVQVVFDGDGHRTTQIVCGSLGLLLLVAVGFGTWSAAWNCYPMSNEIQSVSTRVPTEQIPADDSPEGMRRACLERSGVRKVGASGVAGGL